MPFESIEALYETASKHPDYQALLALFAELNEQHAWGDFERVAQFEALLNRVLGTSNAFPGKSIGTNGHGTLTLFDMQ